MALLFFSACQNDSRKCRKCHGRENNEDVCCLVPSYHQIPCGSSFAVVAPASDLSHQECHIVDNLHLQNIQKPTRAESQAYVLLIGVGKSIKEVFNCETQKSS